MAETRDRLDNTIIHLVGFPGTGKYTIAQEMARQADIRLVDNHLINNTIFTLIETDGKTKLPERVWDNTIRIWDVVADTMVHISPKHFSFVLTNALVEGDALDLAHAARMRDVASQRGGLYVPVRLVVSDIDEHIARITAPDRRQRFKETNAEAPRRYAETRQVLNFPDAATLTLDVTKLPPAEAAAHILAHAHRLKIG